MKTVTKVLWLQAIVSIGIIILISVLNATKMNKMQAEYDAKAAQAEEYRNAMQILGNQKEEIRQELIAANNDYAEVSQKLEETTITLNLVNEENSSLNYEIGELNNELEYYEEVCSYVYNDKWDVDYSEDDIRILAGVIYGENYTSGRWEMMLTGSVVLNRVMSPNFPNTVKEVVYQFDGQYEQYAPRTKRLIGSNEVTQECYRLAEMLLKYGPVCPPYVLYQAHFNQGTVYWDWKGEEFCYKKADKEAYEKSLIKED